MRPGGLGRWIGGALAVLCAVAADVPAAERPPFANVVEYPQHHARTLVVGPEGRSLYASTYTRLYTFGRDPESGRLDLLSDSETAGSIALSPDGRFAYTAAPGYAADRGRMEILTRDPATGLLTHQQTLTSGVGLATIAISPDGRDLYGLTLDDPAIVRFARDPGSGLLTPAGHVPLDPGIMRGLALKIAPDGRELFVAGLNAGARLRREPATGVVSAIETPGGALGQYDVAVSGDGRRVFVGGGKFSAFERDPASHEMTALSVDRPPCERDHPSACVNGLVQPSPDGLLVAAAATDEFRLSLLGTTPGGLTHLRDWSWGVEGINSLLSVSAMEWSPDSRMLYVQGGSLSAWVREGDAMRFAGEFKLPYPSDPTAPSGVEIVGKPKYVKASRVTLKVARPARATSLRLSNEPTMRGVQARRFPAQPRLPWRLRPNRQGKATVYARYMTRPGASGALQDMQKYSVVVDGAAPVVRSARLRRKGTGRRPATQLWLRARDSRSGVSRIQVTTRRSRPGRARLYKRRLAVKGHPRKVWVRAIDKAGNKSRWKRVKRR